MFAADYLARVGFDLLLERVGGNTPAEDEDDPRSIELARVEDHRKVLETLLSKKAEPLPNNAQGCVWIERITWPDRMPGLKTWAGQMTLPKCVNKLINALRKSAFHPHLFEWKVPMKGASGIDGLSCQNSIDIGFNPAQLDMAIMMRPAVELLAIVGLEALPLISFDWRECGFIHDGRVWRFPVEDRDGGYLKRWGTLAEVAR